MDSLLTSLPKTVIAIAAIVLGFLLIIASDPPKTICDAQLELFMDSQKAFLYTAKGGIGLGSRAMATELHEMCKGDNSPGGCFEYFMKLKKLVVDLSNVPKQCAEVTGEDPAVQLWLWKSLTLMTQIAWGERAPASLSAKHAWFDASDLALYCDLKANAVRMYGNERFSAWREAQMQAFPQADRLTREQVWQKSIFSTNCDSYR